MVTAVPVFPKDVRALISTAKEIDYTPALLEAVEAVNYRQKHKLYEHLSQAFSDQLQGKQFAVWGSPSNPKPTTCVKRPVVCYWNPLWQAPSQGL